MSKEKAEELGLTWLAEIVAHGNVAGPDNPSLHAQPALAIEQALKKAELSASDIDVAELNEAFAAVGLVSAKQLGLSDDKVNVNGGAIALGHPLGMSGARITFEPRARVEASRRGIGAAALCGGGGQGSALILRVPA